MARSRSQVRLSRIFSRGFNRSPRSYRDLPPRLALLLSLLPFPLSLRLYLSVFPSRFLSSSPPSYRQFDRIVSRAQTDPRGGERFPTSLCISSFSFFLFFYIYIYFTDRDRRTRGFESRLRERARLSLRVDFENERREVRRGAKRAAFRVPRGDGEDRIRGRVRSPRIADRSDSAGEGNRRIRDHHLRPGNAGAGHLPLRGSRFHEHYFYSRSSFERARKISRERRSTHWHDPPAVTPRDVLTKRCRGASKTGRQATGASDSVDGGRRGEGDC